ncbi:hypothetical protein RM572_00710 [Streptomyces sp. DSM 42041]|uniref:Uncharacterized protein n=1 Tax=Streptomyces hazeniae TaxID=3075538 RepID=A0ABU2NJX3_9ACTN|nr:hypothetical protein [Streptomyces sp. DSM 42041]MDT0377296.1 hypothetical protein [Streptomyces sp. DSM 42041]
MTTIVHQSPGPGFGLMPCCRRPPHEVPAADRITNDPAQATCPGTAGQCTCTVSYDCPHRCWHCKRSRVDGCESWCHIRPFDTATGDEEQQPAGAVGTEVCEAAEEWTAAKREAVAAAIRDRLRNTPSPPAGPLGGQIGNYGAPTEYDLADALLPLLRAEVTDAVRTVAATVAELSARLDALQAGEEPQHDEAAVCTPAQWIWLWNRAPLEKRLDVAARAMADGQRAHRCFLLDHDGQVEELRQARARLARGGGER